MANQESPEDARSGPDGFGEPTPFMRATGLHLNEIGAERVTGWIDLGPDQHQVFGIVHGGVYAAVVEESASFGAGLAVRAAGQQAVGVSNTTNFIRPMSTGRVMVEAVPLHQGRTQQLWEVRITRAEDGKPVALGQVRLQNIVLA
ncbi:MAG TPA: PaaI family thioesterase [Acidimicrobiales bacterium]|nr:PaaI family thioesterase [Acidimicrobiales bacterium]